jgi:hypothetical protein
MAGRPTDDRPDYFRDMPEEFERRPGGPDRSPLRRRHQEAQETPPEPERPDEAAPDGDERERP